MWKLEPDVNVVDEISGQTLLEFAIRKSNMKLLEVRFCNDIMISIYIVLKSLL